MLWCLSLAWADPPVPALVTTLSGPVVMVEGEYRAAPPTPPFLLAAGQRLELAAGGRVVLLRQGGAYAVDGPKSVDPAAFVSTAAPDAVASLLGRKTSLAVAGASRSVLPAGLPPVDVEALLRAVNADSLPPSERAAALASAYLLAGLATEALAVAEASGDPALLAAIRGAAGLGTPTWPVP